MGREKKVGTTIAATSGDRAGTGPGVAGFTRTDESLAGAGSGGKNRAWSNRLICPVASAFPARLPTALATCLRDGDCCWYSFWQLLKK